MTMLRRCSLLLIWGVALWGVLQISRLPLPGTHGVCGVWGCGPPVQALIACHGGWLVTLTPVACMVPVRLTGRQSRRSGWGLMFVSFLGVASVGLYEALTWLPEASEWVRGYFLHRWAFCVITMTDVPLLEAGFLGMVFQSLGSELPIPRRRSTYAGEGAFPRLLSQSEGNAPTPATAPSDAIVQNQKLLDS